MSTVQIRAVSTFMVRGVVCEAGETIACTALDAWSVIGTGRAKLCNPADAAALREAFEADNARVLRQEGVRPWSAQ